MSLSPVAFIAPNYRDFKGQWVKFYESGTTTAKTIYLDSAGSTSAAKVQIDSDGFMVSAGNAVIVPYVSGSYDAYIFDTEADANANTTVSAVRIADNILSTTSSSINLFDNVAEVKTSTGLGVGDRVSLARFYAGGDLVARLDYEVQPVGFVPDGFVDHGLANGMSIKLIHNGEINADQAGAVGGGGVDDSDAIQAAIDTFPVNLVGGGIVNLTPEKDYLHASSILIPANITLNCRGAVTRYTGTDKAFILGDSLVALNYDCKLLNIVCVLEDKSSVGVYLQNTASAEVTGYIEGGYKPYDNTRTNIAVWIDGGNVSSFFNRINIRANHIHEGYRIKTTGTVQATQQFFNNCTILGDQETDNTSIGYNIGPADGAAVQEGQGSIITGGNVEKCNTGIYMGPKAGRVTVVGLRTEIVIGGDAWKFKLEAGAEPLTLIGVGGLGTTYMESASGITGWANNSGNTLIGGDAGEMRLGGFDTPVNGDNQFIGIGSDNPQLRILGDADFNLLADSDATGTGRAFFQVGRGSATHGGGIALHGNAHATSAGEVHFFPAPNKGTKFYNGLGGAVHGEFRNTAVANTTSLWLYDASGGSLKQVELGASSGGYRALRVAG
jgi:hypothetical protein